MDSVKEFFQDLLDQVPNFIFAIVLLIIAFIVAKIVKSLVTKLLKAIKVDTLQEKAGITATEGTAFSNVIANVIYGLILLVVVTSALDQLEIAAISGPANNIVSTIFAMLPNVLGAIIIIAIGVFIAKLVATLLQNLLAGVGADTLIEKITGNAEKNINLSKILSEVVEETEAVVETIEDAE